jgi:hypothetical protein
MEIKECVTYWIRRVNIVEISIFPKFIYSVLSQLKSPLPEIPDGD